MKLKTITIENFRCIEKAAINIRNFTCFIGANNCGKSSVLRAIEIFLNQQSPAIEEWRKGFKNQEILIEGEFDDLQEWERAVPGVAGIVYENKIKLRVRFSIDPETEKIAKIYEAFSPNEVIAGWSSKWSELSADIKAVAAHFGITTSGGWKGVAKLEQVKQRIRETRADLVAVGNPIWSSSV